MPWHDWTRVDAGIFHAFHVAWNPEIQGILNGGLLPEGYYALAEPHAGRAIADVLTLHTGPATLEGVPARLQLPPATGAVALTDAPPRTRRRHTVETTALGRRRSLAIRHVSDHRLVALIEIISPANKDRSRLVAEFVDKAASALYYNVHLLLVDLFPPGPHDRSGMHGAVLRDLDPSEGPYEVWPDALNEAIAVIAISDAEHPCTVVAMGNRRNEPKIAAVLRVMRDLPIAPVAAWGPMASGVSPLRSLFPGQSAGPRPSDPTRV